MLEQPLEETNYGWRIVSGGDVIVGVDQSPEARWAVLWGPREARLRRAVLSLVHIKSSVTDDQAIDDLESEAERAQSQGRRGLRARARDISRAEAPMNLGPSATNWSRSVAPLACWPWAWLRRGLAPNTEF